MTTRLRRGASALHAMLHNLLNEMEVPSLWISSCTCQKQQVLTGRQRSPGLPGAFELNKRVRPRPARVEISHKLFPFKPQCTGPREWAPSEKAQGEQLHAVMRYYIPRWHNRIICLSILVPS